MTRDLYKYFRIEARELIEQLEKGTLDLERRPDDRGALSSILRATHTLKGAARVVKQIEIADAAHAIEDALVPFRDSAEPITSAIIEKVLRLIDGMRRPLAALAQLPDSPASPAAAGPARASSDDAPPIARPNVDDARALSDGLAEVATQLAAVRRALGALTRVQGLATTMVDSLAHSGLHATDAASVTRTRLLADEIRDVTGAAVRDLGGSLDRAQRGLTEMREGAERLRLVPVGAMFHTLERAARDAATSSGRRVQFVSKGGDIRIDPDQLGAVQAALLQAVRNAVAHGIEPEGERHGRGKPPEGRIAVEVLRTGSRASFTCRDDGRGIDLDAVRRAAERKGMRAQTLGHAELIRLLLDGGISTSGDVTSLAGRGIGLDIVRETASRLHGEVSVETQQNQGTTLRVSVPLTASSWDVLLVEAGAQTVAIPMQAVRQTLRVHARDLTRNADGDGILFEGRLVAFATLASVLGNEAPPPDAHASAVVVVEGDEVAVLAVDRLVGAETIVVLPLPELTPALPLVAGVSLDGEGRPRLVVDVAGIVAAARHAKSARAAIEAQARLPILVIDDSLTTRMLEQSILESAGYDVDVATSGEEGLDKARQQPYALFLVDVEMPGIDGFTFVERSRADPALSHVPAILVTSRASAEDRTRGREVGASDYVVKGEFDQKALLARIRTLVG